jgi:hypothetical protein
MQLYVFLASGNTSRVFLVLPLIWDSLWPLRLAGRKISACIPGPRAYDGHIKFLTGLKRSLVHSVNGCHAACMLRHKCGKLISIVTPGSQCTGLHL